VGRTGREQLLHHESGKEDSWCDGVEIPGGVSHVEDSWVGGLVAGVLFQRLEMWQSEVGSGGWYLTRDGRDMEER